MRGDVDLDLFIVEKGGIEITNPSDENRTIITHGPGQFAGDIDLLTHRPLIVTGVACTYRSVVLNEKYI